MSDERDLMPFHEWAMKESSRMLTYVRDPHIRSEFLRELSTTELTDIISDIADSYSTLLKVLAADAKDRAEPKADAETLPRLRMYIFLFGGENPYQAFAFGTSEAEARKMASIDANTICIGYH